MRWIRFELMTGEPNKFTAYRFNHSATTSDICGRNRTYTPKDKILSLARIPNFATQIKKKPFKGVEPLRTWGMSPHWTPTERPIN